MCRRVFPRLCAAVCALFLFSSNLHGENFGLLHQSITLERNLPPRIQLGSRTIAVAIQPVKNLPPNLSLDLQADIESILAKSTSNAQVVLVKPQVLVYCTITAYGKPGIAQSTANKITSWSAEGQMTVVVHIMNTANMGVLDTDTVTGRVFEQGDTGNIAFDGWRPHRKTPEPIPSELAIDTKVVANAAQQIASDVVNTNESIHVFLARGGALDGADKFAEGSLWQRDLETLETMPVESDPKKEAYRLYDIGVANEALGYQAQDRSAAVRYLQQASNDYEKALDALPGEKYFIEPQQRIIAALKHYDRPAPAPTPPVQIAATQPARVVPVGGTGTPGPAAGDSAAGPLTDAAVIEMARAHMDEGNILDNIEHAPAVQFDLGYAAQIQLTKAGVTGRELIAMKRRARASTGSAHGTSAR